MWAWVRHPGPHLRALRCLFPALRPCYSLLGFRVSVGRPPPSRPPFVRLSLFYLRVFIFLGLWQGQMSHLAGGKVAPPISHITRRMSHSASEEVHRKAPKCLCGCVRGAQECSRVSQWRLRGAQEHSRVRQPRPRGAQDCSRGGTRTQKVAARHPRDVQMESKRSLLGVQRRLKHAQRHAGWAEGAQGDQSVVKRHAFWHLHDVEKHVFDWNSLKILIIA